MYNAGVPMSKVPRWSTSSPTGMGAKCRARCMAWQRRGVAWRGRFHYMNIKSIMGCTGTLVQASPNILASTASGSVVVRSGPLGSSGSGGRVFVALAGPSTGGAARRGGAAAGVGLEATHDKLPKLPSRCSSSSRSSKTRMLGDCRGGESSRPPAQLGGSNRDMAAWVWARRR